jgi:multidrug efflux pump subunit AcrA (membrane-fusion protein)
MKPTLGQKVGSFFKGLWKKYRSYSHWVQIVIGIIAIIIVGGIAVLARGNSGVSQSTTEPTVTVQSISSFGDNTNGIDVIGTVQSVSEADLLAQSAGTVKSVNTKIGASVPAGFVIANLDGAAQSASVLQAQGAYDAAVAASKAADLNAANTQNSLPTVQVTVRNTYQSAYTAVAGAINNDVYQVFGNDTPVGPELLINPLTTGDTLPRELQNINVNTIPDWEASIATDTTTDPLTLLANAQAYLTTVASFLSDLNDLTSTQGSGASADQLAAVTAAQAAVNAQLANIASAAATYKAAQTAAAVSQTQAGGSGNGVTSAEASVEEALGALRAAQASYEKTLIRAPIAGTVNFLPISVGDYASLNEHVATVARNNALEVVMELSQGSAERLAVGNTITLENGSATGVVTSIAPALDPTTKQIEVHVAVNDGSDLVDGQSVEVMLPAIPSSGAAASGKNVATTTSVQAATSTSSVQLPLTAVKLLPTERDIFSVDATGHLVAHAVQIGQVVGDRIQILTSLDPTLEIVTDARGLSAGDAVLISSSTPGTSD